MKIIKSKKHKIGIYEIKKISLSCFDHKKFVLDDELHTLAYFTKELQKQIHADDHKEEEILTDKKDSTKFP